MKGTFGRPVKKKKKKMMRLECRKEWSEPKKHKTEKVGKKRKFVVLS